MNYHNKSDSPRSFLLAAVSLLLVALLASDMTMLWPADDGNNEWDNISAGHHRLLETDPKSVQQRIFEPLHPPALGGANEAEELLNFYTALHTSDYPALAAGEWVQKPDDDSGIYISQDHLQCLDHERQGNCHDTPQDSSWRSEEDREHKILNSPGILKGNDPWVWQSSNPLYDVMSSDNAEVYVGRVRAVLESIGTIYLVGDSLTRQWHKVMQCELIHVLGFSEEDAEQKVIFMQRMGRERMDSIHNSIKSAVTRDDIVVINIGHHVGSKLGKDWRPKYATLLKQLMEFDYGIPRTNIFFRTTSVRHYLSGEGDWYGKFKAGNTEPDMHAKWSTYGGDTHELPD